MTGDRKVSRDYREVNVSGQGQYAKRDINGVGRVQHGGGNINAGGDINNAGGNINAEGNINNNINNYSSEQQQTLAEAAQEIQALLEQLDKTYPTDTMSGQIDAAKEAMRRIQGDMSLADRILSAVRTGGIEALKQILNHPAASFVLGFIDEWQKTKATKVIPDRKDARSNITSAPPLGSSQEGN